jgi:hypothetical protein
VGSGTGRETNVSDQQRSTLRKVGAMWRPRPGSKVKATGSVTVNGLRQNFMVLPNSRKRNERDPDFVLMTSDPPEVDTYASKPPAQESMPEPEDPFA